jgi:hypothetical protein
MLTCSQSSFGLLQKNPHECIEECNQYDGHMRVIVLKHKITFNDSITIENTSLLS